MSSKHGYSYMSDQAIYPLLRCCICKNPFVDPVRADGNRSGCRSCLTDYSSSLQPIEETIILGMLDGLLVQCSQCEEINIQRGDFEQHKQNVCKRAIVPCTSADIKCPWKGTREQLGTHIKECVFEPLRPALWEIVMENKQFREKLNLLETSIKELKRK